MQQCTMRTLAKEVHWDLYELMRHNTVGNPSQFRRKFIDYRDEGRNPIHRYPSFQTARTNTTNETKKHLNRFDVAGGS